MPAAPLTTPELPLPASVMPTWSGNGYLFASRRFARTVSATDEDFAEMMTFEKFLSSSSRSCSSTARTSAAPRSPPQRSSCALLSEPPFAPMRMTTPFASAAATTSASPAAWLMFPGLMRTEGQPASIAASASLWSKCMSAMSVSGDCFTSAAKAGASAMSGSATRASSQPAAASRSVSRRQAARSVSRLLSMLSTLTGAPPPIFNPFIVTERALPIFISLRRRIFYRLERNSLKISLPVTSTISAMSTMKPP